MKIDPITRMFINDLKYEIVGDTLYLTDVMKGLKKRLLKSEAKRQLSPRGKCK